MKPYSLNWGQLVVTSLSLVCFFSALPAQGDNYQLKLEKYMEEQNISCLTEASMDPGFGEVPEFETFSPAELLELEGKYTTQGHYFNSTGRVERTIYRAMTLIKRPFSNDLTLSFVGHPAYEVLLQLDVKVQRCGDFAYLSGYGRAAGNVFGELRGWIHLETKEFSARFHSSNTTGFNALEGQRSMGQDIPSMALGFIPKPIEGVYQGVAGSSRPTIVIRSFGDCHSPVYTGYAIQNGTPLNYTETRYDPVLGIFELVSEPSKSPTGYTKTTLILEEDPVTGEQTLSGWYFSTLGVARPVHLTKQRPVKKPDQLVQAHDNHCPKNHANHVEDW